MYEDCVGMWFSTTKGPAISLFVYYCITTSFGTHALGPNSERGRKFTVMIEMGQYALIFERSIFHPINCCPE